MSISEAASGGDGLEHPDEAVLGSIYMELEGLPDPSGALNGFQEALRKAGNSHPRVIGFDTLLATAINNPNKNLTEDLVGAVTNEVRHAESTGDYLFVANPDLAKEMDGMSALKVSRTSIGESSAHQVFFGVITSQSRKLRVAVKPFFNKPDKVTREFVNTLVARSQGMHTFRPLGFVFNGGVSYIITEREDGIEPMDNADWTRVLTDPERNKAMFEDIKKVGPQLARLHALGCYHGDVQLKNLVITESGSVHLIDWEAAVFEGQLDRSVFEEGKTGKKVFHDLRTLFGSLARSVPDMGVGFLDGLTPQAQYSMFKELVIEPYIQERLELIAGASPEEELAVVEELDYLDKEIRNYILNEELKEALSQRRNAVKKA